jgi:hypothetical protein
MQREYIANASLKLLSHKAFWFVLSKFKMINVYFGIEDLSTLTWAHGVNSQEKLENALNGILKLFPLDFVPVDT